MIRLVYSNRTEELARTLARDLDEARRAPFASVFDPFTLVVPNKNVETFVKLALAKAHGIAANLEVHLLRRFLGAAAARATRGAKLVEPEAVTGLLLDRLLDDASVARRELEPVRHYLMAAGDAPDAVDLRRIGLATHIARLFEEYGYSRPDMLRAWETGPVLADTPFASAEGWQRRLWLDLFGQDGGLVAARAAAVGERWLSLADLFAEVAPAALQVPARVHLFGISYVSRAFHTLFARLAEACELSIYTLNPCMEFWEDIGDAPRRDGARFPKRANREAGSMLWGDDDPFHLDSPRDPPALRLWGRPGRENVRLLNELASCDFEAAFVDPLASGSEAGSARADQESSLLRALQHDILVRDEEAVRDAAPDTSLRVLACPSIRREAEAVAGAIWALVRENAEATSTTTSGEGRLRFNEIAVIVPNAEYDAYHTHIGAAFAEAFAIPHHVLDVPLARTSRVAEALDLLISLPFGAFTRKEVMRVVAHPAVMARFPDVDPSAFLELPSLLGIVHGRNHSDHAGTYIERDILNWDQGVRRLALGAFMTGETSGDPRPFQLAPDGDAYLPEEAQGIERTDAATFGALVSAVLADAAYAKSAVLTMTDWAAYFRALASSYVAASSDAEERALLECAEALSGLADIELGDRRVSYRIASELARARLSGLTGARDAYLAGGVAVASFLPMRAIPFKAIFVMGLGEGKFPQGDPRDPLDLRLEKRRPGDVRPREQDKYMFLETVLCARDRLYLSYVDRDALTGEALSPSSVVSDLLAMLEPHLGKEATASLTSRYPLRRYGETDFPRVYDPTAVAEDAFGAPTEARREAQVAALRRHLEAYLGGPIPGLATLRRALRPDVRRAVDARLGLVNAEDDAAGGLEADGHAVAAEVSLSLAALRKFLECPLQGYARYRLGLDEDDDLDEADAEDELLATPALARTMFLREVFLEAQATARPLSETYDEKRLRLELTSAAPVGLFAEAERESHLAIVRGWARLVDGAGLGQGETLAPARFGRADEHMAAAELHDAVVLDVTVAGDGEAPARDVRVTLHGATQPLSASPPASWTFAATRPPSGKAAADSVRKRAIAAFLDHVVLAASFGLDVGSTNDATGHAANVCFAAKDESGLSTVTFPPLGGDEARAYLRALAADLLSGHHAYLLPCEAVLTYLGESGKRPVGEIVAELVDGYESDPERRRFSSVDGPLAHAERYAPPDEARARETIERRFGLFARGRVDVGEKSS